MCARNIRGGAVNPSLPISELSLADFQTALPPAAVSQLKRVYFCGNYGDPAVASDLLEIVRYLRQTNPSIALTVHSNGGVRTPDWWKELAVLNCGVRFGVDGLADTNHLYRQGVNWERLEANMRAFLGVGGRGDVDFLVFRHNEHQVEAAEKFFASIGVQKIQFKSTSRFFRFRSGELLSSYPVENVAGAVERHLEPPVGAQWKNPVNERMVHIQERFGTLEAFYNQAPIRCQVAGLGSIYLTAQGYILPCCWVAGEFFNHDSGEFSNQIRQMIAASPGGLDSLSALRRPLEEIVDGPLFQKSLPASWEKDGLRAGKPLVCAKTCGVGIQPFESQFVKSQTLGLQ